MARVVDPALGARPWWDTEVASSSAYFRGSHARDRQLVSSDVHFPRIGTDRELAVTGAVVLGDFYLAVVYVRGSVSGILAIISPFAVLFTGRLPAGLANFQAMYLRCYLRTVTYAGFLRDEIPAVWIRDDTRRPWR